MELTKFLYQETGDKFYSVKVAPGKIMTNGNVESTCLSVGMKPVCFPSISKGTSNKCARTTFSSSTLTYLTEKLCGNNLPGCSDLDNLFIFQQRKENCPGGATGGGVPSCGNNFTSGEPNVMLAACGSKSGVLFSHLLSSKLALLLQRSFSKTVGQGSSRWR